MDQEKEKDKAKWDNDSIRIFINSCIEQIYARHRQGASFSTDGWKALIASFNQATGKSYDKKQLKNKFECLRKEWLTWDTLFSKETGLGRDPETKTVVAPAEWWTRKIQENPCYKKYKNKGLMFETELNFIFKDAVASGEFMLAPSSSTQTPAHEDQQEDQHEDQHEGLGDSEDEDFDVNLGDSVGVTDDGANIKFTTNAAPSEPSNSGSHGKRKSGECSVKVKKQKVAASKQIADAVSVLAVASKEKNSMLREIKDKADATTLEVVQELISMDEIIFDEALRNRCITLMMDKTCRDIFLSLKSNRDFLVSWLKEMAYDPRFSKSHPPS